jgi:pimeloyl-ACP methyl ester carboxylesterase
MGAAFMGNLTQLQRSWYMFFFQHALSDFLVSANNFAFIDMLWAQWSPGFDATNDLVNAKSCLTDPTNLQAALGYYRATLGAGYKDPELHEAQILAQSETPTQPVLYLHGRNDGCIGVDVATHAATVAPANARVEIIENAGHFMQLEQPTAVNKLIIDWITKNA